MTFHIKAGQMYMIMIVQMLCGMFGRTYFQCVEKHASLRAKRIQACNSPWITPQLKKRLHERDILKLIVTPSGNADDWRKFKKIRNSINNEVKLAKKFTMTMR